MRPLFYTTSLIIREKYVEYIRHWRIIDAKDALRTNKKMVIIETPIFTKKVKECLSDDDYQQLQEALVINPELGSVIRRSGGLRKVRWKLEGKGKSGGIRVIYYWKVSDKQIYMIYCYPKNELDNLTDSQVAQLKKLVERWNS